MAKKKSNNCRPTFEISKAGHLLSTGGSSRAGKILATKGKEEKRKRLKRGCLNGPAGTFKLTDKQKRNLPITLQKAILNHHRRLGKKVYA
jgi:hypothetical protein